MKVLLRWLVLAFAAALVGITFLYFGFADVAATSPHWAATQWLLSTTMARSVHRHSRGVTPPPDFATDEHVPDGAREYDEMCASCHGAPGVEPGVVGQGLNPKPPSLAEEADAWSPAEIFWITANGVRMTGMPAFGPTHSEAELWDIVALVTRLPRTSSAEYSELVSRGEERPHTHRHTHHH